MILFSNKRESHDKKLLQAFTNTQYVLEYCKRLKMGNKR